MDDAENLQVIRLNVKKSSGENIIEVVDGVEEVIDGVRVPERAPSYVLTGDQSEQVEILVEDLENNIIAGILFVIAVLLFFLGVRNATLVGLAIPLSMFLSFLVFSVMGQTLNFIILFSLIIALGMLVDNAIVIIENIYRFREEGYGPWEAARKGTAEVGLAVAASTATTVAAFAPMLLWPGIIGKFMSYMPLTLIVTLTSSLFVALIINPVIAGYFIKTDAELAAEKAARRQTRRATRAARKIALGLVAFTALVVGIANWKTLIFLAVADPGARAALPERAGARAPAVRQPDRPAHDGGLPELPRVDAPARLLGRRRASCATRSRWAPSRAASCCSSRARRSTRPRRRRASC